jgi:hypothetical protein
MDFKTEEKMGQEKIKPGFTGPRNFLSLAVAIRLAVTPP